MLDNLGTVYKRLGHLGQATEHHRQAFTLFRRSGDRDGAAWALNGLGEDACTGGDLGMPDADDVRAHLAALAQPPKTR